MFQPNSSAWTYLAVPDRHQEPSDNPVDTSDFSEPDDMDKLSREEKLEAADSERYQRFANRYCGKKRSRGLIG